MNSNDVFDLLQEEIKAEETANLFFKEQGASSVETLRAFFALSELQIKMGKTLEGQENYKNALKQYISNYKKYWNSTFIYTLLVLWITLNKEERLSFVASYFAPISKLVNEYNIDQFESRMLEEEELEAFTKYVFLLYKHFLECRLESFKRPNKLFVTTRNAFLKNSLTFLDYSIDLNKGGNIIFDDYLAEKDMEKAFECNTYLLLNNHFEDVISAKYHLKVFLTTIRDRILNKDDKFFQFKPIIRYYDRTIKDNESLSLVFLSSFIEDNLDVTIQRVMFHFEK